MSLFVDIGGVVSTIEGDLTSGVETTSVVTEIKKILLGKCKITKILNSEKNSKRKVPNTMAKSNDKTYQTNGQ